MDFFAWDLNNPSPTLAHTSPGYAALGEVDLNGRVTTNPCFNNPDYRAYLSGKIESLLIGYPELVDGIAWGCEREGPLDSLVTGGGNATCFCQFCQAKARELGISCGSRAGRLPRDRPALPRHARSGSGRLLHHLLAPAAQVPRGPQLGVAVDRQLPGRAGRALRPRQIHRARQALRLPPHAEHDLQPLLSRRGGLHAAPQLRRLPQARHLQQRRRPAPALPTSPASAAASSTTPNRRTSSRSTTRS